MIGLEFTMCQCVSAVYYYVLLHSYNRDVCVLNNNVVLIISVVRMRTR